MGEIENSIEISAQLLEKTELKYTPAGVAVLEARLHHSGKTYEANAMRQLEFDFQVIAFADAIRKASNRPTAECALSRALPNEPQNVLKEFDHMLDVVLGNES